MFHPGKALLHVTESFIRLPDCSYQTTYLRQELEPFFPYFFQQWKHVICIRGRGQYLVAPSQGFSVEEAASPPWADQHPGGQQLLCNTQHVSRDKGKHLLEQVPGQELEKMYCCISQSKHISGSESKHSPLVWEPRAAPAMKPFLQMETSEGDDIPQGIAKCYMNHTRLHSETSLLGLSGILYQRHIFLH